MTGHTERQKLVVIGNGMAGMDTVEKLLAIAPDLYDITVFGAEPHGNYNRILLSPLLAGETALADIMLHPLDWYARHGITLHAGRTVTMIDRRNRTVVAADGTSAPYDRVLLATGSQPILLPLPGKDLPGVITYRDIHDVDTMIGAAARHTSAVVIGGGLLGLEAAYGLMKRGMDVSVVHLVGTLMERQLDPVAAAMLRRSLEARGMRFIMPMATQEILGQDRVTGLRFADGSQIAAGLVVMAVGVRPNIGLARKAGLHCERGVVVSDAMQTYDERIYAVGECVQHRSQTYGLVAPLFDQAGVCANHLARRGHISYPGSAVSTRLKVTGVELFSAGTFSPDAASNDIVLEDAERGVYKRIVLRGNRIVGAVLYGDTADGAWYFQHLRAGTDMSQRREELVFGPAFADGGEPAPELAAA